MNDQLIHKLQEYLSTGPIAPTYNKLLPIQKNCVIALKFMCIVHYEVAEYDLYDELTKRPELMSKLMMFDYCFFKYYDYESLNRTTDCLLKCGYCLLAADYTCILTNMAIAHNAHVGLKHCAYCETTSLATHTEFKQCQKDYYEKNSIKENFIVNSLVKRFYSCLHKIGKSIGAIVLRNKNYGGQAQAEIERMKKLHGHDVPQSSVSFPARCKTIDDSKLSEYFEFVAVKLGINLETSEENLLSHNVTDISTSNTPQSVAKKDIKTKNEKKLATDEIENVSLIVASTSFASTVMVTEEEEEEENNDDVDTPQSGTFFNKRVSKGRKNIVLHRSTRLRHPSCAYPSHTYYYETPFQCQQCPRQFARKQDLNTHMRSHNQYKCHVCKKLFGYKTTLEMHNCTYSDEQEKGTSTKRSFGRARTAKQQPDFEY